MNQSEYIDQLAQALCKTQKESLFALKDSSNPFFNSKYADLSSVWDVAREPLTLNGLAVTQTMDYTESGALVIVTTLMHESGQWKEGRLLINPEKHTPQGIGSAITYGRRYSLAAMIGICPADDDGEGAMNRKKTPTKEDEKIKKEMEQDLMSPQDRAQIVKRGREYNPTLSKTGIADVVKWYGEINKLDPNSGEMATRCIDKPGIEKIITDWLDYNLGEAK